VRWRKKVFVFFVYEKDLAVQKSVYIFDAIESEQKRLLNLSYSFSKRNCQNLITKKTINFELVVNKHPYCKTLFIHRWHSGKI